MRNIPVSLGLTVSAMGAMLLLVLAVFERSANALLFDQSAASDEAVVTVFNALRMVVDVLPIMLGPFLAGTLAFGIWSLLSQPGRLITAIGLGLFVLAMGFNIFGADTASVVATLKATTADNSIDDIRAATQAVLRQHHIGLLGFAAFAISQLILLFRSGS